MKLRASLAAIVLTSIVISGCLDDDGPGDDGTPPPVASYSFEQFTIPAIFADPIGLYEPTIDVGPEGTIYVSAHSTNVGENTAPAYASTDDGKTWIEMANLLGLEQPGAPDTQSSAPFFSDEVFIIATEPGKAWGADCCFNGHFPLVGWGDDGATVEYYNQQAADSTRLALDAVLGGCVAFPLTDRPWLAYANGKLLLVNNPGGSVSSILTGITGQDLGASTGPIPLQVGAMDVPPLLPIAYTGLAWGIQWNVCGSTGGFIPGIPDMRDDHFFAVPQWVDFGANACAGEESYYDVIVGNADDVYQTSQTTAFTNSHIPPAETDSVPSEVGLYGQVSFDADGLLYVGAMNNTVAGGDAGCVAGEGGLHFAVSTDDGATFTDTTFRFDRPVSSFYMDGNRYGPGFLVNWGEIDGDHTDWFVGHVFANDDGTLRMENVMLAVDDGPEASRHVQGAAMGPDGRAYLALSWHAQNAGASDQASPGDTPMFVAVQTEGPTMPVGGSADDA